MSIANSNIWYSDAGDYMMEINSRLHDRPESGLVDEWGQHDTDDTWERMWRDAPDDWGREVI
jgi:hypothetical protein